MHMQEEMRKGASFEAYTAVMTQVKVFWVVMPCSVVVGYLDLKREMNIQNFSLKTSGQEITWKPWA
jgi:hypothetical protein